MRWRLLALVAGTAIAVFGEVLFPYELLRAMTAWAAYRDLCTIPGGFCSQLYESWVQAQFLAWLGLLMFVGGTSIILFALVLRRVLREKPRSRHVLGRT